jgi:hypothetical protein
MIRSLGLSLGLCLLAIVLVGCSTKDAKDLDWPQSELFTVSLVNNSNQDTHMWIGAGSPSAANKILPGDGRVETISVDFADSLSTYNLVVNAGRSGAVVATRTLECGWSFLGFKYRAIYGNDNAIAITHILPASE